MQVWSNANCHAAEHHPYFKDLSNKEIIQELQPAAEFSWRERYAPKHGRDTGGILMKEWIELLSKTSSKVRTCGLHGNDCSGAHQLA